ncbi:hypothetical protein OAO62_03870 [Gammaproteobacteria bacterium]|nr:hypothetical protein [Gammaproteobacteria bacterium]
MIKFFSNSFIFKLLSFVIKPLISADVRQEGSEDIDSNLDIVYALSSDSIIDLVALNEICKRKNFVEPYSQLSNSKLNRLIFLKNPKYIVSEQKFQRQKTYNLEEILELKQNITLIPVSISWGNRPDKQQSLFKILFSYLLLILTNNFGLQEFFHNLYTQELLLHSVLSKMQSF